MKFTFLEPISKFIYFFSYFINEIRVDLLFVFSKNFVRFVKIFPKNTEHRPNNSVDIIVHIFTGGICFYVIEVLGKANPRISNK